MFQMRWFQYKHNDEEKKWSIYLSSVSIVIEAPVYF